MNLQEVCAELVRHFRLRPWEIERLDRWTIANVYFAPRKPDGTLILQGRAEPPKSRREINREWARSWGWPDWLEERRWRAIEKG